MSDIDEVDDVDDTVTTEDVPTIAVDQEFDSCEQAFTTYKIYAKANGFSVRTQRSYRKRGEGREVYKKDFVCYRGNTPQKKKSVETVVEKRNRSSNRCNCKAMMRVALVNRRGVNMWHVVEFLDTHNHTLLDQNQVRHLRAYRYISDHCKDRILALDESSIPIRQMMAVIAEEQKVPVTSLPFNVKDVHNFLGLMKKAKNLEDAGKLLVTCLNFQREDSDFRFEYEVDGENRLKHIAWSHANSFRAYQNYGDVVVFDTTYKLNSYDMPVGIWVGVSNFGSSCFFGCCLLRDEKTTSFEWAFQAFLKLMDGKAPQSILTDQDLAMKDAIRTVLPETKHALCMWHITKKFPSYMRSLLKHRYNEWKDCFWELNRVESVLEFEQGWNAMIDRFGLHSNVHMRDLYEERDKWAQPYVRPYFFAGMTTTGRSEAMNASLKRFITKQVNLNDFMTQVTSAVGMMEYNGEMLMTKQKVDNVCLKTLLPLERHAASILTPYAFAKYQDEIIASFSYAAFIVNIPDGFWIVRHMEKSTGGRRVYHLTTESLKCSCNMFEFEGILCRHAVAVLVKCNAFETPKHHLPFRWTREASINLPAIQVNDEVCRSRREEVQALCRKIVVAAEMSPQTQATVVENLNAMLQQLIPSDPNTGPALDGFNGQSEISVSPVQLTPTLNGNTPTQPVRSPPTSNHKGRKRTRRVQGVLERIQRPRMCRTPGCGSLEHDRRNCPLLNPLNWDEVPTQSTMQTNSANDTSNEEGDACSNFSERSLG